MGIDAMWEALRGDNPETRQTKKRVVYLRERLVSVGTDGCEYEIEECRPSARGAKRFVVSK